MSLKLLESSLVRSGISLVQSGLVWFGLVRSGISLGSVWFCLVQSGSVWFCLVQSGSVWFGLVQSGSVWFSLAESFRQTENSLLSARTEIDLWKKQEVEQTNTSHMPLPPTHPHFLSLHDTK